MMIQYLPTQTQNSPTYFLSRYKNDCISFIVKLDLFINCCYLSAFLYCLNIVIFIISV